MLAGFMALFVLAAVLGISMTAINVIKARELAERTGGPLALGAQGAVAGDDRSAAKRLEELQELYRKGLVNEDEFAEKRREILGDV